MEARIAPASSESSSRRYCTPRETIDLLSKGRQAAFAMEPSDRIVYWNRPCEALLGYPAARVLGKRCYEIMAGHDENGNTYCCRSCPVSRQARVGAGFVHPFNLVLRDAEGRERSIRFRTFAVPAIHPELSVIVHVVCESDDGLTDFEKRLARGAERQPSLLPGLRAPRFPSYDLTPRQKEILVGFAEGSSTSELAGRLHIAPVTVRNHTRSILLKFEVHSKLAAVAFAYRNQLL